MPKPLYLPTPRGRVKIPVIPAIFIGGVAIFVIKKLLEDQAEVAQEIASAEREGATRTSSEETCAAVDNVRYLPGGCGTLQVDGYSKGTPTVIEVTEIPGEPGMYLQSAPVDVWSKFIQMKVAASRNSIPLDVNSAFRTNIRQRELYQAYQAGTGNVAAKPGYSNHQMGRAVDIQVNGRPNVLSWLRSNGPRYGFNETVRNDTLHWEYTG